jgi:hypothetical protein
MLSWRLWRLLNYPGYIHPLFWRVAALPPPSIVYTGCLPAVIFDLLILLTLPVGIFFFTSPLGAMAFGGWLAGQTAALLTRKRDQQLYDMLDVTSMGGLRAGWILNALCYRQLREHLSFLTRAYLTIAMPLLGIIVIMAFLVPLAQTMMPPSLRLLFLLLALIYISAIPLFIYVDRLQSLTLGGIVGMLAASYERSAIIAQAAAVGLFLAAQLLLTMVGALVIVTGLLGGMPLLPALGLLTICVLREGIIALLWRVLRDRCGGDSIERVR